MLVNPFNHAFFFLKGLFRSLFFPSPDRHGKGIRSLMVRVHCAAGRSGTSRLVTCFPPHRQNSREGRGDDTQTRLRRIEAERRTRALRLLAPSRRNAFQGRDGQDRHRGNPVRPDGRRLQAAGASGSADNGNSRTMRLAE